MTDNCINTKDTRVTVTSLRGYRTKIHTNSIQFIYFQIASVKAYSIHCVLQTVLFAVQTITFMYTSTVISSAICQMS